MPIIQGGVVIEDGLPRPLDPFGRVRHATPTSTLQSVVTAANAGDVIYCDAGAYDETVTVNKRLSIVGLGGRGGAYIEPSTVGAEGMQVTADDVTLINLGVAGEATASYALNLNACARFRGYSCKFEGPDGTVVLVDGTATDQVGDALLDDCEFAWGGSGILFDDSAYGYPTQVFLQRSRFHNLTAVHVGLAAGGGVANLHLIDCIHDNLEDGTAPTDYIKVDRAGDTGIISGCRFATPTNDAALLTIAAGILWVANATEAGWSLARPA